MNTYMRTSVHTYLHAHIVRTTDRQTDRQTQNTNANVCTRMRTPGRTHAGPLVRGDVSEQRAANGRRQGGKLAGAGDDHRHMLRRRPPRGDGGVAALARASGRAGPSSSIPDTENERSRSIQIQSSADHVPYIV